ncbi:MAG: hypothetical protein B6244_02785 [Candidatus Cloacimonetes bacterium 4572_55]|nr:MAG: hypothetical protein B6244_02785 [Candidatus Cloacimonetes bacterium 4572_55]
MKNLTLFLAYFIIGTIVFSVNCRRVDVTSEDDQDKVDPYKPIDFTAKVDDEKYKKNLNILVWPSYFAPETLHEFTDETGIQVNYHVMNAMEDLFEVVKQEGKQKYRVVCAISNEMLTGKFDLIFVAARVVQILPEDNLLEELDLTKIDYDKVDPQFKSSPYDPGNRFSIPYSWGVMGIAYRKDIVSQEKINKSWGFIFKPDSMFDGKISLLSDARTTIGAALAYKRYSINTTQTTAIANACNLLHDLKNHDIKLIPNPGNLLNSGDLWISMLWNGDVSVAQEFDEDSADKIDFFVPKEGSIRFIDNMCIPIGSLNKEGAYKFINFVLRDTNAVKIAGAIKQPLGSFAYREILEASEEGKVLLENEVSFPPQRVIDNCEYLMDVGESTRYYIDGWRELVE